MSHTEHISAYSLEATSHTLSGLGVVRIRDGKRTGEASVRAFLLRSEPRAGSKGARLAGSPARRCSVRSSGPF